MRTRGERERVRGELICCEACRKTLDFVEEYGDQLLNVLPAAYTGGSERVRGKLLRLLAIWEERKVLPPERVAALRATLGLDQIGGALPAYLDRLGESCLEGLKQERDASLPKLADEPHKASSLLTSHISQVSRSPTLPIRQPIPKQSIYPKVQYPAVLHPKYGTQSTASKVWNPSIVPAQEPATPQFAQQSTRDRIAILRWPHPLSQFRLLHQCAQLQ